MSKITGSEVRGLMEAYGAVYTPQQLTEEQIWEEVETWVNSLIEEGYDLSDYTWEEMYENYITEVGNMGGQAALDRLRSQQAAEKQSNSRIDAIRAQRFGGINPVVNAAKDGVQGTLDKTTGKWTASTPPARTPAGTPPARTPPARTPAGTPPARTPAAPAARPSGGAPAAAKPAPSAPAGPAIGKLGSTSFERRTPTSVELKAAQAARAGGSKPEQALQAAKSAGTTAKVQAAGSEYGKKAFGSTLSPSNVAAQAAAPKPITVAPRLGSSKPGSRFEHLDLFDIVKGHLLDEGYADTEEAAEAIMASMSEEWREGIISEVVGGQSLRLPTPEQSKKSKLEKILPKNPLPKGPQPGGYGTGFGG